ncbi:hypothetical protein DEO72_LG1g1110 [Vigna unguiculata]|uniref:Uncharacterized protein n=1 Tax=Vigna unguiculata TaxID=3917 RepID=A0A4D6KLK3_VIGUN|nr:hypothetical protein DEO72_LG1g1110 [Vigna unguiculata]
MKLNINFITLFSITLVLCFAICNARVSPSVEKSQTASEEPLVDPTSANPTFVDPSLPDPSTEDTTSEESTSVDPTEASVESSSDSPAMKDPEELYPELTSAYKKSQPTPP